MANLDDLYSGFVNYQSSEKKKKKKKDNPIVNQVANKLTSAGTKTSESIAPVKDNLISDGTKESVKQTINQFISTLDKSKELKDIWSNGYNFGDVSRTMFELNPFSTQIKKGIKYGSDLENSDGNYFKESKGIKDIKSGLNDIWSNGWQFGDVDKSISTLNKGITSTILGTTADVGTNVIKGELQTAEGLVDTGRYLTSDLVKLAGYNETADKIKQRAIQNTTGFILGENDINNNPIENGWSKKIDEYSVFDNKIDQINQSIGQQAFRIGLQKALMGNAPAGGATEKLVKGINELEIFAGSYGTAKSQALQEGYDDKTATIRGVISGTSEFISENLFDNVPGFKVGEWKSVTKLKDFIGDATEKSFGKSTAKILTKIYGGMGEGFEEILSNGLETAFTNVANYIDPDYVYGMKDGQGIRDTDNKVWKMFQDIYGSATSQESKDAFISAFFSTLITAGMTSGMNNAQRKQVIEAYAKDNNMSVKEATELFDAIKDARLEQVVDEKTGYTERTELEEQATQQLVNEMQNNPKLNLEELFLATPKNRQESQFVFTNDERKNIKSEQQKLLANDLQRINNTKEVHDTYNIVNRVQAINKTQQYHLTTTEGLYEMGIVNKNENGDYIMPNGTPYVPRGLNYGTNGDIYVNVDVGTQSGTQAMYHEMFEGFKKASPKQYETFKQMVRDIVGEQTIQDEVAQYKQMYGEELTDNIEDEIINDKFGELAENQKFINKIADNRSVLEKFVDSIKNMIKYVKGTPQERQLIKLQNKLEKEFAKRYKKTDFSQNEGDTAYSINDELENQATQIAENTKTVRENILDYIADNNLKNPSVEEMMGAMDDYNMLDNSDYDLEDYRDAEKLYRSVAQDIYNENNAKYSLNDYEIYQNELNETLNKAKNIGEDFYNNLRNQLDEQKERHPLEYNIYEQTKSRPATNENYNSDFFKENRSDYDGKSGTHTADGRLTVMHLQKGDNLAKLSFTENQDKIWIDELYVKNQKQGYGSEIVNAIKDYAERTGKYVEAFKELQTAKGFWDKTLRSNTKYSLTKDSEGRTLTKEQQNYFKDSKNVDENGNLKVMYHGSTSDFNIFDKNKIGSKYEGYSRLGKGFYFTDKLGLADFWATNGNTKSTNNKNIKEVYLNMVNPFDINEDYSEELSNLKNEYPNYIDDFNLSAGYRLIRQVNAFSDELGFNSTELLQRLGYDSVIGYDEVAVFEPNQIKNVNNTNPTTNEDIRYSLAPTQDNKGRNLTKEQQDFYKNVAPELRDENGNLMTFYHGTPTGDFTIFKPGTYFSDRQEYASGYENTWASSISSGKVATNSKTYEVYLNITNPFTISNQTAKDIYINEYIKGGNSLYYDPYTDYTDTINNMDEIDWTEGEDLKEWLQENHPEYDGLILDEGGDGGYGEAEYRWRGKSYVPFNSNQIKNVDNLNPTENADIRYSLTKRVDSELDDISDQQYNYFKNTKAIDQDGELEVVHHGTPKDFSIFDINKVGSVQYMDGFYFTNSEGTAKAFGGDNENVMTGYINIEHPISTKEKTITYNQLQEIYNKLKSNPSYDNGDGTGDTYFDDVLSNYGDVNQLGIDKLLKTFYDSYNTDDVMVMNMLSSVNKDIMYGTLRDVTGIDGQIIENPTGYDAFEKYYIAFNPDQFKLKDNKTPTNNVDVNLSLTSNKNIRSGEIAPVNSTLIQEQLSNLTKQMDNISTQLDNMQKGYVETTKNNKYEPQTYNPMTEEEANMYQDAITNDEAYMKSLSEQDIDTNANLIKTLTNEVQSKLDVNKYNRPRLEEVIRDAVENNLSSNEIADRLSPFSTYEETSEIDGIKEAKKSVREMPIKVPDYVKRSIADYGKWKQKNFGKITFSNHGKGVDVVYAELCDMYPGLFDESIINETDQLLKIADVVNSKNVQSTTQQMDMDYIEDVADFISDYILNDRYNTQMESQASLDKDIQFDFEEDIAPTTIRSQESVDNYIENRDIAPVNSKQVEKQKSQYRKSIDKMYNKIQEMFINRNHIIDEFSKATGNKEVKFAGDNLNNVSGETSFNVNSYQTDINGHWIGKGVYDIFAPAKKAGLYNAFNDYLIQKSNIERHNVGKGSQVPLAVSQQLVNQYETENPIFKTWAKDVYKYFDNILQEQVDAGLITQKQYDDYRGEDGIYRSYVPFYEGEMDIKRFFDDEGNIRPYTTLKKSKGNATDVSGLLSVEESMARQTYAQKKAIRQNMLFGQIVNSLDKYNDAMDIDIRNNPTNLDDVLYTNENGDKVLTAYVNGERTSAIISDELYNELKADNENRIKQLEQDFALITNPLQKMSNIRRNLITTWNPVFLARNAIKDIQDAVINSKHTGSMLKNYYGLNKTHTPAIVELALAKTQEAQQFLALYGSESTLGDYSKTNKFTRLNELIELAPRYAEFKASLDNGESINEAIYNAREVTTNFGRGGYITKAMNRNGFTFLNANIQGLDKAIRNITGQNGVKGVVSVITKGALFAVLPSILNHMLYSGGGDEDKDEEYEALPDYVKDNYYLIKLEDGNFLRIPKGRLNAVFGSLARRLIETGQTGENQLDGWTENAWSQIGVGDSSGLQTIFTPLKQAQLFKNDKDHPGEAWYGGDIVPTRLQNKPAEEQYDEKTDLVSKKLGELFNLSPKKINYVIDQYSGGIGDLLLPMITPASQNGAEGIEHLTSPVKDAFVVNSIDDNKYAGEFYDLKDELETIKNGSNATDEDVLKYKYMEGISKELANLYKEKREVQADTEMSNSLKYKKAQNIQNEINNLAKNALNDYKNISGTDTYSSVNDEQYYKNNKNEWTKVSDADEEFTSGMTQSEKTSYYNTKNKISKIYNEYNKNTKGKSDKIKKQYSVKKKDDITKAIINSGLDDYSKAMLYSKYYSSEKTMTNVYNAGYDIDTYITAKNDIELIRDKYQVSKGYSVEFRKNKTIAYVNSLNIEIPQKAMLIREYYSSFRSYNNDIVNYVADLDITYDEKKKILEGTGMKVKGNNVSWK